LSKNGKQLCFPCFWEAERKRHHTECFKPAAKVRKQERLGEAQNGEKAAYALGMKQRSKCVLLNKNIWESEERENENFNCR
jgi:hypothetical protein